MASGHTITTTDNDLTLTLPLETLASTANAYASANGVQVELPSDSVESSGSKFQCAPISLLPNAFPEAEFVKAQVVMPSFNLLVDRISRDSKFLRSTLGGSVSDADQYTAKLLQLYNSIYVDESGNGTSNQPNFAKEADFLGIFRSDYMLSQDLTSSNAVGEHNSLDYQIKQVELNTIAASFLALSLKVSELHSYLLDRYLPESSPLRLFLQANQNAVVANPRAKCGDQNPTGVPMSPNLSCIPLAMKHAVDQYVSRFPGDKSPVVLFVVQDGERNTVDQRMLEVELWKTHRVAVVRRSLTQLFNDIRLDPLSGSITLSSTQQEIALVYYRAGYAPTDYPDGYDGIQWQARETLERSRATKCPSLGYHLAGTKKVQQALARPGVVEQFFDNDTEKECINQMRQSFAGLYSMDESDMTSEDYQAIRDVLLTADGRERYVLKPQREGGGYNFYGNELYRKLKENIEISDYDNNNDATRETAVLRLNKELGEYILMQRLFPPQQQAILLRAGRVEGVGATISELGCFGTILMPSLTSSKSTPLRNEYAGFLLRTKFSNVDEGGVASGFATLSSPYLC